MNTVIDSNQADQRLDRFLRKYFKDKPQVKLSMIFAWMRKGIIKVNGRKQKENYRLQEGDELMIKDDAIAEFMHKSGKNKTKGEQRNEVTLEQIQKMILYEDNNWLVFNKPAGIVMHGGNKQENVLAMHDYLKRYTSLTGIEVNETFSPQFCYRLDKDTSGVLIAAKNYEALQYLNKLIRERKLQKQYLTVVVGAMAGPITMDQPLKKVFDKGFGRGKTVITTSNDPDAQEAWSEAKLIKTINDKFVGEVSLAEVIIKTGRMHQIRVHLANQRHPVLGDIVYGLPSANRKLYKKHKIARQLLHCQQYSFWDEIQGKQMVFKSLTSKDIAKLFG